MFPFHRVSCTQNISLLSIRYVNSLPPPVIVPTFNVPILIRTIVFNRDSPNPSRTCQFLTEVRRDPCASLTGYALAIFEARNIILLNWHGFYGRVPILIPTTVIGDGRSHKLQQYHLHTRTHAYAPTRPHAHMHTVTHAQSHHTCTYALTNAHTH